MTDHAEPQPDIPTRLDEMVARLNNITPSGCETLAVELAAVAAEIRKQGAAAHPVNPAPVPAPVVLTENHPAPAPVFHPH